MKKSVSNSSIDKNFENNSLLFLLLLFSSSQFEMLTGERLNEREDCLPHGIASASVALALIGIGRGLEDSSKALLASRILLAKSSKVFRLSWCLLSMTGVWRTAEDLWLGLVWLTIHGCERICSAVNLTTLSLTNSLLMRSLA